MALALYRKYRPATFAEVVGQEHVTDPLRTALESGRINHAYLFSGPRGCGKTSSARILARSLNCEQGPTPEPCGVCNSCVSLAPGGPGNIDVTELDAASHGGVDDTRELRDRAFFAPAESRYRVFIVDEAHMITTQGFNALLKIVEEPPEHLVFVFATTEPEKVLPTIRSRTHHYPFRLIPPGTLRKLLERICAEEGVAVAAAVYPLVIRAGGGSARDSLSVLDQLVSGAGPEGVTYERAVALLGVTDVSLIDDVVDALAAGDRAAVFEAVDRLVEAGHDPRRFATDLLQRLRDITLLQAVPEAVERGIVEAADDEVSRMVEQAGKFGAATLTRYGEILHVGLTEMRGATAPRLLLELLCARMLLPAATTAEPGLLERLERLERRSAIAAGPPAPGEAGDDAELGKKFDRPSARPVERGAAGTVVLAGPRAEPPAEQTARSAPAPDAEHSGLIVVSRESGRGASAEPSERVVAGPERGSGAAAESNRPAGEPVERTPPRPQAAAEAAVDTGAAGAAGAEPDHGAAHEIGAADVRRVWQEIQDAVKQRKKRTAALLVSATVRAVENDILVLSIGTAPLARLLSEQSNTDVIAEALHAVLGVRWRVRCEHGDAPAPSARGAVAEQRLAPTPSAAGGQASAGGPQPGVSSANGSDGIRGSFSGPASEAPGSDDGEVVSAGGGRTAGRTTGSAEAGPASGAAPLPPSAGVGSTPGRSTGSAGAGPTPGAVAVPSAGVGSAPGRSTGSAGAGPTPGAVAVPSAGVGAASGGAEVGSAGAGLTPDAAGGAAAGLGPTSDGPMGGSADAVAPTVRPGSTGSGQPGSDGTASPNPTAAPEGAQPSGPTSYGSGASSPAKTSSQSPGQAPSGGAASGGAMRGGAADGASPDASVAGVAAGRTVPVVAPATGAGATRSTGAPSSSVRPQFERRSARGGGSSTGADDGVPLPPEPADEDAPPDDDEVAMLAEIDAGDDGGQAAGGAAAVADPEAAAIALLTTQLGARAINRR